jgi:maltose-binding protein MalE
MKFTNIVVASSILLLTACTSSSDSTNSKNPAQSNTQVAQSTTAEDACKDFPVPLYPSRTSITCSHDGDRYTASIDTADSIQQVTEFYQTQVQSSGWQKDPDPLISPDHTVVTLRKAPGHAVISTFPGQGGKGCSFQINAFPKG